MKSHFIYILFVLCSIPLLSQNGTVTGSVSDSETNEPLPGVNVVVKNTTKGTNTDFDGNFSIEGVSSGDVLVFSYIGYKSQEISVGDLSSLDILLVEDTEALEEVVVLGYVSQKAANISGSVSTVSEEQVQSLKPVRMEDALQGLPGVNMFSNGSPGAKPTVIIRGVTSYTGNAPLVIVDGITLSLDDMNALDPSDIESISVLKDASTTALYGVRGGNGVIVITTKSGTRNQDAKFSFNTSYGQQSPEKTIGVLNATEYAAILNEMSVSSGGSLIYPDISNLGKGTDWQKEIFRTDAPIVSHSISASGGSEKTSYYVSAGFTGQEGLIYGKDKQFFDRSTFRANFNTDLSSKLKLLVNNRFSNMKDSGLGDIIFNAINMSPTTPVFADDGSYAISNTITQEIKNPMAQISNSYGEGNTNTLSGKIELQYDLMKDLKITSRIGYTYVNIHGKGFTPYQFYGVGHNATNANPDLSPITNTDADGNVTQTWNSVSENKDHHFSYTYDLNASYKFSIDQHNINVFAGFQIGKNSGGSVSGSKVGVPFNSWDYADLSSATGPDDEQRSGSWQYVSRRVSMMARAEYDYNEKYLASFTIRRDGSTSFGQNNKFGYFPSASLGWVASNEDFFNLDQINFFKVRASYGSVGNDNASSQFGTITTYPKYTFGGQIVTGSALDGIPNLDVSWENQVQANIGFDLRMFDSKVSLTFDYYKKTVDDLLFNPTLSLYLGTPNYPSANIGKTETSGMDINFGYQNDFSENISINTNISFTTADNLVVEIANGDKYIWGAGYGIPYNNLVRFQEGESPGIFWGYLTDGIFQNQSEIDGHALQPNAVPGDIRYVDVNGDGVVNADDRTKIGDPFADFYIGWNLNLNVYDFDLSVTTYGSFGNDIFRGYERNLNYTNKPASILSRWTGPGTSNTEPRASFVDGNNNIRPSTRYVEDGSYFKIRNVQLGYNFNMKNSGYLDAVRLYLQGKNLMTFTDYSGFDPEMSGGVLDTGIDRGNYPSPRTVSVGLNVKF